jgi:glycosyltransferase involved in cell wall biosynthesis
MDISVIVPLYNEAESLPELEAWIRRVMEANNFSYEIIFINDGSTDESWEVIKSLKEKNSNVKGVCFRRNYGKSPALNTGFARAKGDIVITTADERNLALKIAQLNAAVWRAHLEKEPSIISDYVYTLAQTFSTFYNSSPIMSAESNEVMSSRLALAKLVRDILVKLLYLLGIESPEVMLKKA